MDNKSLKIASAFLVKESKLSKQSKLQMLNFIQKEASEEQLMALLMDGGIVQLDEQAKEIVRDRFKISEAGGRIATLRKTTSSLAGAFSYATPFWLLYRKIRSAYDVCTKRCGTYELNTAKRQLCMAKCKVEKIQAQLKAAESTKNEKEISRNKLQLIKAQQIYQKYIKSFKKRGAEV